MFIKRVESGENQNVHQLMNEQRAIMIYNIIYPYNGILFGHK